MVVDRLGVVLYANRCAELIFQRGELTGKDLAIPLNPGTASQEINLIRSDSIGWAELRSAQITWHNQPAYVIAVRDITARKLADEELRIAAIAFETQEGMIVTDASAVILRVNRAFTRLTGYSAEEAVGRTPHLLSSGRHDKAFYRHMWDTVCKEGYWQGEIWNRRKSGKIFAEWLTISAVTEPNGGVTQYVGCFSDITQNQEAAAEIHRLAYYDALTNLPNRRLLQDRLGQALIAATRNGRYGAILFIDLDNFKMINDTRGHFAGDQLLVEVAHRLRATVREGDTLGRLGGDEFVVLLENLGEEAEESATQAKQVAEKMLAVIGQPYLVNDIECHSSASIGIGLFRQHEVIDELLGQADLAMYQAKKAGRNAMRFFDPTMQAAVTARAAIENDLRHALEHDQFKLYYQLQVLNGEQIVGAEVLIRWQHPERGLVAPDEFIPLAEETGLILPIGQWVLESACARLKLWESNPATRNLQLAVNVSTRQFQQADFVEKVRQTINRHGINPAMLKLEVTESMLFNNIGDIIVKMQALMALGVFFSMDDFGTGFSSLSYLTQLPLNQLKIDRSFVRNIGVKPADAAIVQTIIGMARNLGIGVIAEGVETEDQRTFLEHNGCTTCQGYLFSKPVQVEEFESRVTNMQLFPSTPSASDHDRT